MSDPIPLERLLSLAVHELRTPITVASGYLRMILMEQAGPLTEKQRKVSTEAERACRRVAALVAELSELGRLLARELPLARQEVDVGSLLRDAAGQTHEGEDRGIALRLRCPEQPAVLTGDRARLLAAVSAVMHAALRERVEPGTIEAQGSIVRDPDGTWAIVAIGDAASLAPLAAAHRTPPPFEEWRGGMGLALPLARQVIEAHGGAIWSAGAGAPGAAALRLPVRHEARTSLEAERTALSAALAQVHWNRRKAAQILGVSYKTLLNKIKETGIERP
jgi:K+-sensing histidine kinase KdpD